MVRAVPGPDRGPRGHLPAGSAVARAVGEGPRGRGAGGEDVPRQPRESSRWPAAPAGAWSPGRSGPSPSARPARTAATRPAGDGPQEAAHQPVLRGQRADRGTRARAGPASRSARWNSPRSTRAARTGGPWASRPPAPPISSAAHSRPPRRWCSPRPFPVAWNPARMNPGPTRSGCADGRAPTTPRRGEAVRRAQQLGLICSRPVRRSKGHPTSAMRHSSCRLACTDAESRDQRDPADMAASDT